MRIKWLAHAAFLVEGNGLRIITDPYDPADLNLPPITEQADIVIRSSSDDRAHAFVDTLPKGYELVTATEIVDDGVEARGVRIEAVWSQESLIHKEVARDNAMYRFTLEGIDIAHLGDVGNPLSREQLSALAGVDLLLALAGGPPTIELEDLRHAISVINPRVVIPMHFRIPGPEFFMLPVTEFTKPFPPERVQWFETSEVEISSSQLPDETHFYVLKPEMSPRQP